MVSTLAGLLGGLLGAIVTGVAAMVATDEPIPATVVWAKYLGDGVPAGYERRGAVIHLFYGAVAGALFVVLAGGAGLGIGTLGGALLWAVGWSAVLLVVAVGFWQRVMVGGVPEPRPLAELAGGHLVYGVVLGLTVYALGGL